MGLRLEIRRKIFHLVSTLIPLGYLVIDKEITLIIIAGLFILSVSIELGRIYVPEIRQKIHPIFSSIMRVAEENKISGATYLLVGAWVTIYFFEKNIAITALLLVSLSDAAAAIIGTAFGKVRIWGGKSLEGSTAYFAMTGLIMIIMDTLTLEQRVVGLFTGTIVELLPVPLDDNLTMPIIAALAMQLVSI